MMSWRDQLRLGWRIIRWIWWPENHPWWENVMMWITTAIICVGLVINMLWPFGIAIALVFATVLVRLRQDRHRL
jgi:hypothetical protein